ncbi:MAG: polyphosphate polymerase domain-containing protein [Candidatus Alcyoniella australis]|nr:polyphosphate polymerase domain-containing protein [Candidatus Alcyoniella australis]
MSSNGRYGTVSSIKRYENKFLIPESLSAEIRDYIRFFSHPDPLSEDGLGNYTVHSLYLDTPDLAFYMANHLKVNSRLKPRVRFFGNQPNGTLFLEVKRRQGQIVWKTRERISTAIWPKILLSPEDVDDNSQSPESNIEDAFASFTNVTQSFQAIPMAHVRYRREAYVSDIDNYVRITFDRRLSGALARGSANLNIDEHDMFHFDDAHTSKFFESPVVLEIKCESLIPQWVVDLVQRFRLTKRGFSKYYNTMRMGMFEHGGAHEVRAARFMTN